MSLNNRISIRDSYIARGAVDCQVATFPNSVRGSEATSDINDVIVLSNEKRQKHPMELLLTEPDMEDRDRVLSECPDFVLLFFSHVGCGSLGYRHSVILIAPI